MLPGPSKRDRLNPQRWGGLSPDQAQPWGQLRDRRLAALRAMRLLRSLHPHYVEQLPDDVEPERPILIRVSGHAPSQTSDCLQATDIQGIDIDRHQVSFRDRGAGHHRIVIEGAATPETIHSARAPEQAADFVTLSQLEMYIAADHPDVDLSAIGIEAPAPNRFVTWALLLPPLESVKQDAQWHPEGDALYHSLQAFEIARQRFPFDEEMLVAALLHDVGKAVEGMGHVEAGLQLLAGTLTPREEFLIAHHVDAQAYLDGTLPHRMRMKLRESEWFEDLMALRDIDHAARERGVTVCSVQEAIDYIRGMEDQG